MSLVSTTLARSRFGGRPAQRDHPPRLEVTPKALKDIEALPTSERAAVLAVLQLLMSGRILPDQVVGLKQPYYAVSANNYRILFRYLSPNELANEDLREDEGALVIVSISRLRQGFPQNVELPAGE